MELQNTTFVLGIALGILKGILICYHFVKKGPRGDTGAEGRTGPQGLMGMCTCNCQGSEENCRTFGSPEDKQFWVDKPPQTGDTPNCLKHPVTTSKTKK